MNPLNRKSETRVWYSFLVILHLLLRMPFIIIDTQLQYQPASEVVPAYLYKHTVFIKSTDDLKFKFFNVAQSIRTSVLL